jgi:hypothetical protein
MRDYGDTLTVYKRRMVIWLEIYLAGCAKEEHALYIGVIGMA